MGEGVELVENGAALGPQRVRFVQDLSNPSLLGQGRQGNARLCRELTRDATNRCATKIKLDCLLTARRAKKVIDIGWRCLCSVNANAENMFVYRCFAKGKILSNETCLASCCSVFHDENVRRSDSPSAHGFKEQTRDTLDVREIEATFRVHMLTPETRYFSRVSGDATFWSRTTFKRKEDRIKRSSVHSSIPSSSFIPRLISSSSLARSARISFGARCSVSSCTISL